MEVNKNMLGKQKIITLGGGTQFFYILYTFCSLKRHWQF